ncbi:MAG: hypothetical protein HY685_04205 [Chloroflexi bacterium]|nr:hypothetical protein [Chloroflexota bacterium]
MIGKRWLSILLALGLMGTGLGVAYAQGEEEGARRAGLVGIVSSYNAVTGALGLDVKGGPKEACSAITVTGDTKVKTPGESAATAVAGTLEAGAKVAVLVERLPDGSCTAIQVVVKPVAPTSPAVIGTVVSVENGLLTITRPDGTTKTIQLPPGVTPPAVGEVVTAFARPPRGGERGAPPTLTGLVRAEEVHQRLRAFLQTLASEQSTLPEKAAQALDRRLTHIAALLDNHLSHRLAILQQASEKKDLPAQARAGIQKAIEKAHQDRDEAQGKAPEGRPGRRGS